MKTDVLFIHGGMTFKNCKDYLKYLAEEKYINLDERVKWSGTYLAEKLGRKYRVIRPIMPMKDNAKYEEWKIYFERHLPLLSKEYILIGESLGGIFLAKYLSENKLKRKAKAVFMVAPPFDNSLPGEDLVGGFKLVGDLSLIMKNTKKVTFMFSADDPVVPLAHAEKFCAELPEADIKMYKNKNGHFQVKTFPEIVKMIKE